MATKLRAAARKVLEPALVEAGFTVSWPHFQRKREGRLDLLSVQHDKWGGGFFLEFARHDAGDLKTSWGDVVPEDKIDVAYTDPGQRARLLPQTGTTGLREDFFRYDDFADDRSCCEALMREVVSLLPQALEWLENGRAGPNISAFRN